MFQKVGFLKIFRNSYFTGVSASLSAGFKAIENRLLTKFLEVFPKFWKVSRKSFVIEHFSIKWQAYKVQPSVLRAFKTPENH